MLQAPAKYDLTRRLAVFLCNRLDLVAVEHELIFDCHVNLDIGAPSEWAEARHCDAGRVAVSDLAFKRERFLSRARASGFQQ